mmetsp:Transcript_11455/g.29568  ORF Transcript_11455/g.29568 Transcript_11455/m.29568 type:complete len:94 (-) Transcript_11455:1507-1788(-)
MRRCRIGRWLGALACASVALLLSVAARGALAVPQEGEKPAFTAPSSQATDVIYFTTGAGGEPVPFRARRTLYQETQSLDGGNFLVKLWARQSG